LARGFKATKQITRKPMPAKPLYKLQESQCHERWRFTKKTKTTDRQCFWYFFEEGGVGCGWGSFGLGYMMHL
jgi:hypothetical protein